MSSYYDINVLTDVFNDCVKIHKSVLKNMKDFKEFENMSEENKTLDITSAEEAKAKISDLVFVGNGDLFKVLAKASSKSQGWMKSTKGMETPYGVVIQVTTQQGDNVAEALTFVPGVKLADDLNGGRKLVAQTPTDYSLDG